jgi:hypothetical protein
MQKTSPIAVTRARGTSLALAVCLLAGVGLAGAAQADGATTAPSGFSVSRTSGADRYETAAAVSRQAFAGPGDAGAVVIVNGTRSVDGLTASYLAGVQKAPILYVSSDSVPSATATELRRLTTRSIYVVGGGAVVSESLAESWRKDGYTVTRVAGEDRYATAAAVAVAGGTSAGELAAAPVSAAGTRWAGVFVASGETGLADALAVSPIAYAKHWPIVLTKPNSVPSSTTGVVASSSSIVVVGGTSVVSDSVVRLLGAQRISGADRQGTAVAVAEHGIAKGVYGRTDVGLVAAGDAHLSDALVASSTAGKGLFPLLYTDARGGSSPATTAYLKAHAMHLTGKIHIFGGESAVSGTAGRDAVTTVVTAAPPAPPAPPSTPGGGGGSSSDTTAPVFVSASHADHSRARAEASFSATYGEALSAQSTATAKESGTLQHAPVSGTTTVVGQTIIFTPASPLVDGIDYVITFSAKDVAGNAAPAKSVAVTADATPPTIQSAEVRSSTQVVLTLNEGVSVKGGGPLMAGTFHYASEGDHHVEHPLSASVSGDTVTLTFAPAVVPLGDDLNDQIRYYDPGSDASAQDGDLVDAAGLPVGTHFDLALVDRAAPTISSARAVSATAIDVVMSEDVYSFPGNGLPLADRFTYDADGAEGAAPVTASVLGGADYRHFRLTFSSPVVALDDNPLDVVAHVDPTPSSRTLGDTMDSGNNDPVAGPVPVTDGAAPTIMSATVVDPEVIEVVLSESTMAFDGLVIDNEQFWYDVDGLGGQPAMGAASVVRALNDSTRLRVSFHLPVDQSLNTQHLLDYVDADPQVDEGDVVDESKNQLSSPTSTSVTSLQ